MLLDTGADASTLPFSLAKKFCADPASELVVRKGKGVGGAFRSHMLAKPPAIRARLQTGMVVDEFDLPELDFVEGDETPGILGRDALFASFELRMTSSIIELIRRA